MTELQPEGSGSSRSSADNFSGENPLRIAVVGGQMLFVAFGALVLVPLLTGLDPSVALFTAGTGTLIFQLVTRRQIPIFLGSSFAFIAPILYSVEQWGMPATLGGIAVSGLFYLFLSLMVRLKGTGFLYRVFPPVVVGPVIIVIGLSLADVAVNMAMGKTGDGTTQLYPQEAAIIVAAVSLASTLVAVAFGKSWYRLIPIVIGVVAGGIVAAILGLSDFSAVQNAAWVSVPPFTAPEWNINAILFMIPVALAPAVEHLGDILAISSVSGKDFMQTPGLHRTLLGDGLATAAAAMLGGPPNTTYSEVTGAVVLTRMLNPVAMTWAALLAIVLAFMGKLGAFLGSLPGPVMGGILVLLFGSIAAVGLNTMVKARVNMSVPRNLIIVALSLVFGLGDLQLGSDAFSLQGISLCAITAVLLHLLLPENDAVTKDDMA